MNEFTEIPQPQEIDTQQKERAMASYLMMFVNAGIGLPLPFINLIAAFIYYYAIRKTSPFVNFHAYQSFLSQVPVTVLNGIAVVLGIRVLFFDLPFTESFQGYLIAVVVVNLVYIVFSIIAAVKAYQGRMYYFIFFGKVAYMDAFRKRETVTEEKEEVVNKPPQL
jgi:uncharacterized Tic20 family protein